MSKNRAERNTTTWRKATREARRRYFARFAKPRQKGIGLKERMRLNGDGAVGHVAGRWIPPGMVWDDGVLRAGTFDYGMAFVHGRCWYLSTEVQAHGRLKRGHSNP